MEPVRLMFFSVAFITIISAIMVITSKHPVRAVLLLVLTFFSSAILWLILGAEFLAVSLVVIYVGAVMVLFLFVVMMLDVDTVALKEGFNRTFLLGVVVAGLIVVQIIAVLGFSQSTVLPILHDRMSNIRQLGSVLFTEHLYAFLLAGVILFVAIVSAIALTFRGLRKDTKAQKTAQQLDVSKASRLRLLDEL